MKDKSQLEHRVILEERYRHGTGSLGASQIETYDVDGYLVLENLLDGDDLAAVKISMANRVDEIAEQLVSNGLVRDRLESWSFEKRLAGLFADLPQSEFLKFGRGWRDRLPGYFDLMTNPKILDAIESLIGPEIYSNPVYNTRPKISGVDAGAVPWHQDKSYWPDAEAIPVLTAWVAICDATIENGCLNIWPGTHRLKVLSYHSETKTGTAYTETDREHLIDVEIVPVPVPAGSVIIFNDRVLHMSLANDTDGVRWSADLRYQPIDQDPMPQHGAGFLARSAQHPQRAATLDDWLAKKSEHDE